MLLRKLKFMIVLFLNILICSQNGLAYKRVSADANNKILIDEKSEDELKKRNLKKFFKTCIFSHLSIDLLSLFLGTSSILLDVHIVPFLLELAYCLIIGYEFKFIKTNLTFISKFFIVIFSVIITTKFSELTMKKCRDKLICYFLNLDDLGRILVKNNVSFKHVNVIFGGLNHYFFDFSSSEKPNSIKHEVFLSMVEEVDEILNNVLGGILTYHSSLKLDIILYILSSYGINLSYTQLSLIEPIYFINEEILEKTLIRDGKINYEINI